MSVAFRLFPSYVASHYDRILQSTGERTTPKSSHLHDLMGFRIPWKAFALFSRVERFRCRFLGQDDLLTRTAVFGAWG